MPGISHDGDDVFVKGHKGDDGDGWPIGTKITSVTDGDSERLHVQTQDIQVNIDYSDNLLNYGEYFNLTDIFSINVNESKYYAFEVGSGDQSPYVGWKISGLEDIEFYIYESPTYTRGTAVNTYNSNRNYPSVVANTLVYLASSVSGGTTIYKEYIPSKSGRPETSANQTEFIFAIDTNYIIQIKIFG